jgi:hypothetical protein
LGHIDGDGAALIVAADNLNLGLFAHCKNRMLRRDHVPSVDRKEKVAGLNAGDLCGSSRVDILK